MVLLVDSMLIFTALPCIKGWGSPQVPSLCNLVVSEENGLPLPAVHRCFAGSADPPGSHPRSQWRKLSAEGLYAAAETAANREEIVGDIDTRKDAG